MTVKRFTDVMKPVETSPEEAQEELAGIALEIHIGLNGGGYHATGEKLGGIDRGLVAADERPFVEPGDVAAAFAGHRPA